MRQRTSDAVCARDSSPRGLRQPDSETAPSVEQIQTYKQALAEALGHRSYILLVLGFFTCGFQLGFVTCICRRT